MPVRIDFDNVVVSERDNGSDTRGAALELGQSPIDPWKPKANERQMAV
jgi:hypothetical protein